MFQACAPPLLFVSVQCGALGVRKQDAADHAGEVFVDKRCGGRQGGCRRGADTHAREEGVGGQHAADVAAQGLDAVPGLKGEVVGRDRGGKAFGEECLGQVWKASSWLACVDDVCVCGWVDVRRGARISEEHVDQIGTRINTQTHSSTCAECYEYMSRLSHTASAFKLVRICVETYWCA